MDYSSQGFVEAGCGFDCKSISRIVFCPLVPPVPLHRPVGQVASGETRR